MTFMKTSLIIMNDDLDSPDKLDVGVCGISHTDKNLLDFIYLVAETPQPDFNRLLLQLNVFRTCFRSSQIQRSYSCFIRQTGLIHADLRTSAMRVNFACLHFPSFPQVSVFLFHEFFLFTVLAKPSPYKLEGLQHNITKLRMTETEIDLRLLPTCMYAKWCHDGGL